MSVKSTEILHVCTDTGKTPDITLLKKSGVSLSQKVEGLLDAGYRGIDKLYAGCRTPKMNSKLRRLTKAEKARNRQLARKRVVIEHVFAFLKLFKMFSTRYRNRRQKFLLRIKLIATIYNKLYV